MEEYITDKMVRRQAPKYYIAAIAWPVYLFLLPLAWNRLGPISLLLMVFPGAWLYVWMGCLMHESWHKYVPNVPNTFFYDLFSYMLVTDPQVYRILHGYHHSKVNTWEDTEFHPFGKITNTRLRKIYNFFEIIFGVIVTFGVQPFVLPRHEKYKAKYRFSSLVISTLASAAIWGGIGVASYLAFRLPAWQIYLSYILSLWFGAFLVHHDQLIEHGNLIVEGDIQQRQIMSRNLRSDRLPEKALLFLLHRDCGEHTLHHTQVRLYSRPFPGKVPMPADAVYISLPAYLRILTQMVTVG